MLVCEGPLSFDQTQRGVTYLTSSIHTVFSTDLGCLPKNRLSRISGDLIMKNLSTKL